MPLFQKHRNGCWSLRGCGVASANAKLDLETLHDFRLKYPKKSFVWLAQYKYFKKQNV